MNQATRKDKERLLRSKMTELKTMWGSHIPLDDNWRHLHELDQELANATDQLRLKKTLNFITGTGRVALLAFAALGAVLLLFVIGQMF